MFTGVSGEQLPNQLRRAVVDASRTDCDKHRIIRHLAAKVNRQHSEAGARTWPARRKPADRPEEPDLPGVRRPNAVRGDRASPRENRPGVPPNGGPRRSAGRKSRARGEPPGHARLQVWPGRHARRARPGGPHPGWTRSSARRGRDLRSTVRDERSRMTSGWNWPPQRQPAPGMTTG